VIRLASAVLVASAAALAALPLVAQDNVVVGTVGSMLDDAGLPGARVEILELGLTATTDDEGRYVLAFPADAAGKGVEMRASLAPFQPAVQRVTLSAGVQADFGLNISYFEELTVGSRAVGIEAATAVPVEIFSEERLDTTGASETNQILEALAPSFNFPRPTITDGTDSVRPATLRGLGSDQVLVLVNGKRRHTGALVHVNGSIGRGSTGVDLNAIPASAIGSIEVLEDGAAAQYGSDAIGGVINVNLKDGVGPLTLEAKLGATTHSDGQLVDASLSQGWKLGIGSLFASLEYRDRDETNRAGPDPRPQGSRDPVEQPNHHWGDSKSKDVMAFFNGSRPIGRSGSTSFYAFGGASKREGSHGGFFRRALQSQNWPQIYPNGFLPLIEPEVRDVSLESGVRGGAYGGWFWDASIGYGDNEFEFNVTDSLNTSLGPAIPPNQTSFYAGTLEADQLVLNGDFSRGILVGLASPLNVAFGVEARREGYQIRAGEPSSYLDAGHPDQFGGRAPAGAQVFPGFRPSNEVDVTRDSYAVYVDLEGDVHYKLRLGLAGRFEDYEDFGSTGDYKLTARLQLLDPLVLRAAVATGFRAPSLGQSYFSTVSTNFLPVGGVLVPFEIGTFPVSSPVARALGAKDLGPEKSDHVSAGIVWNPISALQLDVDYYAVDIADRVVLSGNFTGAQVAALLAPFNVTGARFFTNAIDTETRGYDVRAAYAMEAWSGRLNLTAGYNHTKNEVTRVAPTPPQLAGLQEVLFDAVERRRVECGQPRDNLRLGADWDGGTLFGGVHGARYGEYCLVDRQVVPQTFEPEWLADVEIGHRFSRITVAIGAQNVFDTFPDRHLEPNSNFGILTYPSSSPFGMNGRFVYTRASVRF
jgi:iron complex outermembrane receptor protein